MTAQVLTSGPDFDEIKSWGPAWFHWVRTAADRDEWKGASLILCGVSSWRGQLSFSWCQIHMLKERRCYTLDWTRGRKTLRLELTIDPELDSWRLQLIGYGPRKR